jgi:hypothetical protein
MIITPFSVRLAFKLVFKCRGIGEQVPGNDKARTVLGGRLRIFGTTVFAMYLKTSTCRLLSGYPFTCTGVADTGITAKSATASGSVLIGVFIWMPFSYRWEAQVNIRYYGQS